MRIRLAPIRQGEGDNRASSQAAYPSFPPKGEKLAHSAAPPFPTEPAYAGLRRGPRFGTRRFQRTMGSLACLSLLSFFTRRKMASPKGVPLCKAANWFWSSRILHSLSNCSASIPPVSLRTPPPLTGEALRAPFVRTVLSPLKGEMSAVLTEGFPCRTPLEILSIHHHFT